MRSLLFHVSQVKTVSSSHTHECSGWMTFIPQSLENAQTFWQILYGEKNAYGAFIITTASSQQSRQSHREGHSSLCKITQILFCIYLVQLWFLSGSWHARLSALVLWEPCCCCPYHLRGSSTNRCLYSRVFTNSAWSTSLCTFSLFVIYL